jgi:hypothetical protein
MVVMQTTGGRCRLPGCKLQTVQTLQTSILTLMLEKHRSRASRMALFAGRTHLKSISYALQNFSSNHICISYLYIYMIFATPHQHTFGNSIGAGASSSLPSSKMSLLPHLSQP